MNEKVLKVIEAAKSRLGNPYVFGMWGRKCTPSVRRQYAGYNPSHKSAIFKACPVLSGKKPSCDGCKWQDALAFDCRGFTYWCLLTGYGKKLQGGGCTSPWGYKVNWIQQGVIHYAIPAGLYTAEEIAAAGKAADSVVFALRSGSKGDDVVKLQNALNALGYDCGAADGIFGAKTEAAVRNFQSDHSLAVDGIAGKATQEALYAAESVPRATYTVTLRNVPQADAVQLTARYGGEMAQEGGA